MSIAKLAPPDQSAEPSMLLSIIIVSWNTCDLLAACLTSLALELTHFPADSIETLVIDNGSADDSVDRVQRDFPWVRLLLNKTNLGFAAASNQGMQMARGRYILLLNADTRVLPKAILTLVDLMESQPRVGATGARHLHPDGSLQVACFPEPTLARELWRLLHLDRIYAFSVYPLASWSLSTPRAVDVVQGAALLVRRSVLAHVGLFDTDYFMYSEEVDLCHRIRQAGWSIVFVPAAAIIHYGGQSTRQAALPMFLQLYRSKILYFRKHRGAVAAGVYKVILLLAALLRLLLTPLVWLEEPARRRHHLTLANFYRRLAVALPTM